MVKLGYIKILEHNNLAQHINCQHQVHHVFHNPKIQQIKVQK